jgi:hypothetical protein
VTKGQDVSTSIVSRASQGVSEAVLAAELDEALWTAWKLRSRERDARRAALFLKAAKLLSITPLWIVIAGWLSGIIRAVVEECAGATRQDVMKHSKRLLIVPTRYRLDGVYFHSLGLGARSLFSKVMEASAHVNAIKSRIVTEFRHICKTSG